MLFLLLELCSINWHQSYLKQGDNVCIRHHRLRNKKPSGWNKVLLLELLASEVSETSKQYRLLPILMVIL